jgi:catecholate siderophore receptor
MLSRSASFLALAATLAAPAAAENLEIAALEDAEQTITVTGQREQYGVETTRTATRTETAIKDIPQSVSVISESQIEDQALRSIADV